MRATMAASPLNWQGAETASAYWFWGGAELNRRRWKGGEETTCLADPPLFHTIPTLFLAPFSFPFLRTYRLLIILTCFTRKIVIVPYPAFRADVIHGLLITAVCALRISSHYQPPFFLPRKNFILCRLLKNHRVTEPIYRGNYQNP